MSNSQVSGGEGARSRLRTTLAAMERHIQADMPELRASFADLVAQLDLGPEPATRRCPACAHTCMREATLCGNCWTKLEPPKDLAPTSTAREYDLGGEG